LREFHFTLQEIFGIRISVLYGIPLLLLAVPQYTALKFKERITKIGNLSSIRVIKEGKTIPVTGHGGP
jgi:hypothetical protein